MTLCTFRCLSGSGYFLLSTRYSLEGMASRRLLRSGCTIGRQLLSCQTRRILTQTVLSRTPNHRIIQPSISRCLCSTPQRFESINIQDAEDFQKNVMESKIPVIVDFHATWCGPCKLLGPRLESLVSTKEGLVKMAKIDIDNLPELTMKFGVQSVPTVLGVKNGKIQSSFTGLQEDDILHSFIERLLN